MENPDCGSLSVWKTTAAFPKEVSGKCRWHSCKRLPGNAGDISERDYREMAGKEGTVQGNMREAFYQCITDFIFVEHLPQKADIIFVPGGNYPEAALQAAEFYHRGLASRILPSGKYSILDGSFPGKQKTEWEYLRDVLVEAGVPETAILKEDHATFTYENAIESRKVTDALGMKIGRAILSCQAFHARRCLMYYQEQFPETEFLVCPVETKGINRENWFLDRKKIDVVLGEVERCGSQFHEILGLHCDKRMAKEPQA